jgi:uncharacterized protein DUF5658
MLSRNALTLAMSVTMCIALIGRPQVGGPSADERATHPAAAAAPAPVAAQPATPPHRPSALVPLYVSFAALQGLDVHSTLRAPAFGGREANPIVGSMLGSPAAFVAAKVGMTAGIYYVSERLWKRHKAAAIITMVALNSTYGAIVAHNYAVEARASGTPRP